MKKKNKIILLMISLLIILSLFFLFLFFRKDENSLNLQERQWIENNKNNVIDVSVMSNIPGLTYEGKGLIFDFIDYVSDETGLTINPVVSTKTNNQNYSYGLNLKDKVSKSDILIYTDNYVLISSEKKRFNALSDIKNKNIGILQDDIKYFTNVLDQSNTITAFNSLDELKTSSEIDSVVMLKSQSTEYLISNDYNINYQFDNNKYYVLSLNGAAELNSILRKNYNRWSINYHKSYNESLLKDYYNIANIDTASQTDLKSKHYTYGFVIDGVYGFYKSGKLNGYNKIIMRNFSEFAGVKIKYKNYDNYSSLINDFNNNKLDVVFGNTSLKYTNKFIETSNNIKSRLVIASSIDNKVNINSIYDLNGKTVYTVKNSKIEKYLKANNIKVKTFINLEREIKNVDDHIIILELDNYDFYKTRYLKNCKIDFVLDNIEYNYVAKDNQLFSKLFNFYINYVNLEEIISNNYDSVGYKTIDYTLILLIILIVIVIIMIIRIINRLKNTIRRIIERRKDTLTKEDKIKFIDQLTSLKNRAYLNSKVEEWDESDVYPQCVIIIDLNNVSYINDNYGREEGDKTIRQAANILIQSQLSNTEIIRTDGNEFLIYAVGYKEKDIFAYLRSLSKLLKGIDHGFGASIGYSVITDEIKTFDDAVNEATIEMRQNKEEQNK